MQKSRVKYQKPIIKEQKVKIGFLFGYDYEDVSSFFAQCSPQNCPQGCVPSCFLAGTSIRTAGGKRAINVLKAGDVVESYNFSRKTITQSTIRRVITAKEPAYLSFNDMIHVTPYHRFWTNGTSWMRAKDVNVGDKLFGYGKRVIVIRDIKKVQKNVTVYNLSLFGVQKNFFAEDVLVHNTKCS